MMRQNQTGKQRFPIGFWNYVGAGEQTAQDVKEWADLGMSFAMSPEYSDECPGHMREILDACLEKNIKVILCNGSTRWFGASSDPAAYRARFERAYASLGHHPAVWGFHIGDEPSTPENMADCPVAYRIQKEIAPELHPYLNLLPYWDGLAESVLGVPDFDEWMREYLEKGGFEAISYDCYAQMNPNGEGLNQYFENLRRFVTAAEKTGAEAWTTLLSVGHFRYRVPDEDDLRWQLNSAVACGIKGILWFFVYMRDPASNYRLSPIDQFGERTETFDRMSRVNRTFLHWYGDFFMEAKHLSTYHLYQAYGQYPLYQNGVAEPLLLGVTSHPTIPGIVSFFEKDGEKFVVLVNNSSGKETASGVFVLHMRPDCKVFQRLTWNGTWQDMTQNHDAFYERKDDEILGGDWLAPGQMAVYRIG